MDENEDITTKEDISEKYNIKDEQQSAQKNKDIVKEPDATEETDKTAEETETSSDSVHDTAKISIKDSIEQNKDVINIFNIFRNELNIDNTNNGIIAGDNANFQNVVFEKRKEEQNQDVYEGLSDKPEQLEQWITNHYDQFDVAFLVACATFHDMPYSWINESSEALYNFFGQNEKNSIEKTSRSQNIQTFGAEICPGKMSTYIGKIEVDCVCFSKDSQISTILKTIWNEFPQLRKVIVLWLKKTIVKGQKTMSDRARDILSYLSGLDFYYFSHKMIDLIIQEKTINDDLILVQIISVLYQKPQYEDKLEHMLKNWSKSQNVHYLLTTMLVCVTTAEKNKYLQYAIHTYTTQLFDAIRKGKANAFFHNRLSFFAAGMRKVIFYRILIEELYEIGRQNDSVQARSDFCLLFFELFRIDVMLSDFEENQENESIFIKLVSIKSSFQEKLCVLWNMLWQKKNYRMLMYDFLGQYFALMPQQMRRQRIHSFVYAAMHCKYSEQACMDFITKIEIRTKKYESH